MEPIVSRRMGRAIALTALGLIVVATLRPTAPGTPPVAPSWCVGCGELGVQDFVLNVVLFLPFGFGLVAAGLSPWAAAAGSGALSLGIEVTQFLALPGRDPSLGDFVANTFGACLGAIAAAHAVSLARPAPSRSRRLTAAWLVLWLAVQAVSVLALSPSILPGAWRVQFSPGDIDWYTGAVTAASLNGRPVLEDELLDRAPPLPDSLVLDVQTIPELVPAGPRAIVHVVLPAPDEILYLAQDSTDLLLRSPRRAMRMGLRTPELRQTRALQRNTPAHIVAVARPGSLTIKANAAPSQTLVLTPGLGWALLLPVRWPLTASLASLVTFLWLLSWFTPAGYWLERGRPQPVIGMLFVALGLGAGLALIPLASGMPAERLPGTAGAIAGLVAGAWLSHRVRRNAPNGSGRGSVS